MDMSSGATVQGDVTVSVRDGNVRLDGTIAVITPDIKASNGIIRVTDGVLIPLCDASVKEPPGGAFVLQRSSSLQA